MHWTRLGDWFAGFTMFAWVVALWPTTNPFGNLPTPFIIVGLILGAIGLVIRVTE